MLFDWNKKNKNTYAKTFQSSRSVNLRMFQPFCCIWQVFKKSLYDSLHILLEFCPFFCNIFAAYKKSVIHYGIFNFYACEMTKVSMVQGRDMWKTQGEALKQRLEAQASEGPSLSQPFGQYFRQSFYCYHLFLLYM